MVVVRVPHRLRTGTTTKGGRPHIRGPRGTHVLKWWTMQGAWTVRQSEPSTNDFVTHPFTSLSPGPGNPTADDEWYRDSGNPAQGGRVAQGPASPTATGRGAPGF